MMVVDICRKLSSPRKVLSQIVFFIVFEEAIYFTLTNKVATVGCFLEDYEIVLPATLNTKPLTEC